MEKGNSWFEAITEHLLAQYKSFFLSKMAEGEKGTVKKLFLHMEGVVLDHDVEADTAEGTGTAYTLGLYTEEQLATQGQESFKWLTDTLEETEGFWGPPEVSTSWSEGHEFSDRFQQFQHCTVLAYVAQCLLNDKELKPYFSKGVHAGVDVDFECDVPMFRSHVPKTSIREEVVDGFVSKEENKKLFLSLWKKKVSSPGTKLLKQLGIAPLPDYPSKDDIWKVDWASQVAHKKEGLHKAIEILETYLTGLTPYTGNKASITAAIQEAIEKHEIISNRLGIHYREAGNLDKAEQWWQYSHEVLPSGKGSLNLCLFYEKRRPDYPALIAFSKGLVTMTDADIDFQCSAHKYLASGYLFSGDVDKAVETYQKLLEIAPKEDRSDYRSLMNAVMKRGLEQKLIDQKTADKVLSFFPE